MTKEQAKKNQSTAIRILIVLSVIILIKVANRIGQKIQAKKPQEQSLADARAQHKTQLLVSAGHDTGPLPEMYRDLLEHTEYIGPLGTMGAVASPVDDSGVQKPAVVWVTGGFGGIPDGVDLYDSYENDQGIASFLGSGIVMFLPSFRGEHENPGVFECFYGEVHDLVAAVEHVAQRVDVDPEQIYLMGHSTGGTNVLLASMLTDIPVGVVSFGGAPDMNAVVADGDGFGVEPYDITNTKEVSLRSATLYTNDIRTSVLYIEGAENWYYAEHAQKMERKARRAGVDFTAAIVQNADHFSVLRPIKDLLAERIGSGTVGLPSPDEVQAAYTDFIEDPNNQLLDIIRSGSAEEIQRLLESGADPNIRNVYGWPALIVVADSNEADAVSAFIEAGADVNARNGEGGTPLIVASIRNQKNIKVLLDAGADVNAIDKGLRTALMYAAAYSADIEPIDILLEADADVNLADEFEYTALMYAAINSSNPALIKKLVDAGADIHAVDDRGLDSLMYASIYTDHPEIIQELIRSGSIVNRRTVEGVTPLILAARYTENPMVVQMLLDEGAQAHYIDNAGLNALYFAQANEALKDTVVFEMLLKATE